MVIRDLRGMVAQRCAARRCARRGDGLCESVPLAKDLLLPCQDEGPKSRSDTHCTPPEAADRMVSPIAR